MRTSTTSPATRPARCRRRTRTRYGQWCNLMSSTASTAGRGADLGLGEVDDAVGPVDEDQPERHQAVEQADERAEDVDAEHRRVVAKQRTAGRTKRPPTPTTAFNGGRASRLVPHPPHGLEGGRRSGPLDDVSRPHRGTPSDRRPAIGPGCSGGRRRRRRRSRACRRCSTSRPGTSRPRGRRRCP